MKNTVRQHLNRKYLAPELRTSDDTDEIDLLLDGKIVKLDIEELQDVLGGINRLGINTLLVQQGCDGFYYVKVDSQTVRHQMNMRLADEIINKEDK